MKKTSVFYYLTTFFISFNLLTACEQKEGEKSVENTVSDIAGNTSNDEAGVGMAYQSYLQLKESLVNDNAEEAKKNADQLKQKIESSQIENRETLANAASQIAATTNIDAQREAFGVLSNQFIEVVKKNPEAVDKAYIQHCPMALNNQGAYWVSNSEEIKNPYMGQKMLTCGSTKETID